MSEAPAVFHFHPTTGEFIGASYADADPMDDGRWVVPASATLTAPTEPAEGFALVFANDAWQQVEDHRGETWWKGDGEAVVIDFLGDPAAEGLSSAAPPTEEPTAYTPPSISDRQFFHILALDGLITEAEALAAVKTGDAPAAFETFIAALPETEQFGSRMLLEGATTFERNHPLTAAFGAMYGMTAEQIDDIWRRASAL